jgi:hypothetical protein
LANPDNKRVSSNDCQNGPNTGLHLFFAIPHLGPISILIGPEGPELRIDLPFLEIANYTTPPNDFNGFDCVTVLITNQQWNGQTQIIPISFSEGNDLRIIINTESTTEFVFNSGRLVVSAAESEANYLEYDYFANTIWIDSSNHRIKSISVSVDGRDGKARGLFCTNVLSEHYRGGLAGIRELGVAFFRDLINGERDFFQGFGPIWGAILLYSLTISVFFVCTYFGSRSISEKSTNLPLTFTKILFWGVLLVFVVLSFTQIVSFTADCPHF